MNGASLLEHGCWKRIGVSGDRSCADLALHAHCRNCPAYSDAAQRTLQMPVESSYRAFWADQLRRPPERPHSGDACAIVFRIGQEWLALSASMVLSVAPVAPAHRLPHRGAAGLLGVANVGGRLLPALSLAPLLGIDDAGTLETNGRHVFPRLLVVDVNGQPCAVPVAELHGLVRYASAHLTAPAATVERPRPEHLSGVLAHDGMQVGVLDGARIAQRLSRLLK